MKSVMILATVLLSALLLAQDATDERQFEKSSRTR